MTSGGPLKSNPTQTQTAAMPTIDSNIGRYSKDLPTELLQAKCCSHILQNGGCDCSDLFLEIPRLNSLLGFNPPDCL